MRDLLEIHLRSWKRKSANWNLRRNYKACYKELGYAVMMHIHIEDQVKTGPALFTSLLVNMLTSL